MFESELGGPGELLCACGRLFDVAADYPVLVVVYLQPILGKFLYHMNDLLAYILLLPLDVHEVRWAAMAPPELTRYTPVLDVLEPAIPFSLR